MHRDAVGAASWTKEQGKQMRCVCVLSKMKYTDGCDQRATVFSNKNQHKTAGHFIVFGWLQIVPRNIDNLRRASALNPTNKRRTICFV